MDGRFCPSLGRESQILGTVVTNAKPVRASDNPVERARDKVIASLAEQKAMAEAKIAGQHFAPTHMVWRKGADGQRVQVETPKRLRAGWFT